MKYAIIEAEIVEWLKVYEGEKFHAILSDPPYALISIAKRFGPGQVEAQEGVDGRYTRLGKGFMGQTWDGFDSLEDYQKWVAEWASLMIEKVLHPGALCLFFGGTRTWHHLAVGLENGGFEIYDSLMWLYGSGFPKSHDISKGIDKAAGKEREIIEERTVNVNYFATSGGGQEQERNRKKDGAASITTPATDDAKFWDGYGTALKPAWEPIILCRAPRKGQTFASLALEFGSGALNIDEARIATNWDAEHGKTWLNSGKGKGKPWHGSEYKENRTLAERLSPYGRWPSNLLLSHHEDCQLLGDIITPGRVINRWKEGMKPFGDAAGEEFESEQLPPETIERWACVAECPVRQLDDQAGIRSSGSGNIMGKTGKGQGHQGVVFGVDSRPAGTENISYGDSGFVSRFFYCGKASRAEKDAGLETFFWKRVDRGYERVTEKEWLSLDRKKRAKGCIHPTVKPLSLLQYLSTLLLPPKIDDDRRIFIPFSGSGSEIIGALKAGWDLAVGVEAEAKYNEIAVARIKHNLGMFLIEAKEEHHGEDKAEENNVEVGGEDSPL